MTNHNLRFILNFAFQDTFICLPLYIIIHLSSYYIIFIFSNLRLFAAAALSRCRKLEQLR